MNLYIHMEWLTNIKFLEIFLYCCRFQCYVAGSKYLPSESDLQSCCWVRRDFVGGYELVKQRSCVKQDELASLLNEN